MRDFALEVHFGKWEFAARHHMTASDLQAMSVAELLEMAGPDARAALENCWLGYTETWGAPDLREAIASTYDTLGPEHVHCFAGAEEGIYAAMRVMLSAEDHAVVVVPNYQAAETLPLDICAVSGVPLRETDKGSGWRLDLDDVVAAMRPNTKLVSINFPNNPTGYVPERATFDGLIDLCRKRGVWLFCDEVYRGVELDDARRLPHAADAYERGLSLNVMSKALGLPGLRIGWLACRDTGLLERIGRYKHYLSICNSAPSERLAVAALGVRDTILERNRTLVRANVAKLEDFLVNYPDLFEWCRPDGGCIAFPRWTGGGTADEFCRRLVEEAGVLLLPASIYRSELIEAPTDRFRIGFGRAGIEAGLAAMGDFLDRNHNALAA